MTFNSKMQIPGYALQDFKNFAHLLQIKYFVPSGLLKRIYLHWSVAPHGMTFPDYNVMVLLNNGKLSLSVIGNPQDNALGFNNNPIHSATWHRNTGSVSISIDGMDGANVNNFGYDAPSELELLYLCGGLAAIAKVYNIDIRGVVALGENHLDNNGNNLNTKGEFNTLTHGEVAVIDSYPSERWDLGVLKALPVGQYLTPEMRTESGNTLRECAHNIKLLL